MVCQGKRMCDVHLWNVYVGDRKKPTSPEPINNRFYLPGSLSQIVCHAVPGYEPLPKPYSLLYDELEHSQRDRATGSDSLGTDDPDMFSGSLNEESASGYSSQHSMISSSGSDDNGSASERNDDSGPLIQLSDVGTAYKKQNGVTQSGSDDLENLVSNRALESWLDEQPDLSKPNASGQSQARRSSARILIRDISSRVKPKSYILLDPVVGNGLKVEYTFSSEISSISSLLVCVEVSFEDCTEESMAEVLLVDEESNRSLESSEQVLVSAESASTSHNDVPTRVSMEEITSLEPGQMTKRILHVRFHHHLLPLKLALWCNGKKHPVKLWPDIGYFVKPLQIDVEAFTNKESQLPGMFEYIRRCTFTDHLRELSRDTVDSLEIKDKFLVICESLALKMLSNANLFLVSVDLPVVGNLDDASDLRLRFGSEILSNSVPCLITLICEGKCSEPLDVSVKVNCEETVFGLNLLNRVVNILVEPSSTRS